MTVYPPHGNVRVSAPIAISEDSIRLADINKLNWINRQQLKFTSRFSQLPYEFRNGESHYFWVHSDRFKAFMDCFMPQWRIFWDDLNNSP